MYDYNNGEPERLLTKDDLLDDVTLYWLTNSATSAARLYWETAGQSILLAAAQKTAEISLPVAITVFPEEVYRAPETWARRAYRNLIYFHEVDKGGHFAAWEEPRALRRGASRGVPIAAIGSSQNGTCSSALTAEDGEIRSEFAPQPNGCDRDSSRSSFPIRAWRPLLSRSADRGGLKMRKAFYLSMPETPADHTIGLREAVVTVVEYGDFECPNCKQAAPAVKLLLQRFAGRIRFVYRHFPLEEVHPHALPAAETAESAGTRLLLADA